MAGQCGGLKSSPTNPCLKSNNPAWPPSSEPAGADRPCDCTWYCFASLPGAAPWSTPPPGPPAHNLPQICLKTRPRSPQHTHSHPTSSSQGINPLSHFSDSTHFDLDPYPTSLRARSVAGSPLPCWVPGQMGKWKDRHHGSTCRFPCDAPFLSPGTNNPILPHGHGSQGDAHFLLLPHPSGG